MITEKQTELTWQDMERLTNDYELNLDTIKVTDRFKSKTPDSIYLFYGETHANMAETDCPVCGS